MSTRVADRVDGWDERSVAGGYRGLRDLADADFSGVVRAGGAELYMTKGTVVGVEGGSIEDFEDAEGTALAAPSPALPLLAVMQSRGGEVRARYYTEDTPISEVDGTLSDGGFTGYVELSENVLSGDYYLVYHRGRSMSVAFVGNSSRLVDGEEAFRTADDEVGIYEVHPAEVEAIDIPEPEPEPDPEPQPDPGTTATAEPESDPGATAESDGESGPTATAESDSDRDASAAGAAGAAGGASATDPEDTARISEGRTASESGPEPAEESTAVADETGTPAEPAGETAATGEASTETPDRSEHGAGGDPAAETSPTPETGPGESGTADSQAGERTREAESSTGAVGPDRTERGETESRPGGADGRSDRPAPEEQPSGGRAAEHSERESTGGTAPGANVRASQSGETGRNRPQEPDSPSPRAGPETRDSEDTDRSAGGPDAGGPEGTSGEAGVALERRSVPSLDPERTTQSERSDREPGAAGGAASAGRSPPGPRAERGAGHPRESGAQPDRTGSEEPATDESRSRATAAEPDPEPQPDPERGVEPTEPNAGGEVAELRERLEEREAAVERLEGELEEETARREDLEAELAEVREERDELAAEVERLEGELERVEEEFGVAAGASQRLTAAEALAGTDLFVRYRSKNDTTLADAHDGEGGREDLTGNLRLEQHTQFDAEAVAVEGKEYGTFIRERVEYQFVTWVVEELLFEVRDTGQTSGLSDLYDALPDVDRAELNGTVAVRYTEDGEEHRGQETFDIVLRDRMGNPLFLANLNDSREGATEGMMEGLITAAERVGTSKDSLAGAFLVTESFFEPEALETAAEATKDGLLSRDSRKSFVNLSRKRGYHLCLVEARNQNFHLAVPEL